MKPNTFLSAGFGLAVFAAAGYTLYLLARLGARLFDGIPPTVTTVTLAAAVALLLAASMIANGLHAIARRDGLRQQREIRAVVYESFLRPRMDAAGPAAAYGQGRRFVAADDSTPDAQMLLHASPAVLNAYLRLCRAEEGAAQTGAIGQQEMAHLVRAMRRDLGQRAPDLAMPELTEMLAPPARERVS